MVISSDSFVITPRFFKGGNIGELAVTGTVNDILMAGGIPRYLTCSLIIEEGFDTDELGLILDSMKECAARCNVAIVTGDTKVVPAGMGDGLYINTAGVGFKRPGMHLDKSRIASSDKIIVSRSAGEHGLSIMAERCGLESDTLASDCAPLTQAVELLHAAAGEKLKFMRDATRGGVWG
ncbi:MAG: hydrogenase expression/formation protein HypE, partial [Lentisphaeria bacterium]|nr:hydrogenase expression/formation protein HypE [Lentisphaeria bacterium]